MSAPLLPPGVILAAAQSRSGKTTLSLALMAKLSREGIDVAPFKAGPDFIDPIWHRRLLGKPSYSLDTFMVGREACRELFDTKRGNSFGVVEGVMGLYDGRGGVGAEGSTADLARALDLPVILIIEARGMAGSIAPMVAGFVQFAEGFTIAGVIANRIGSKSHAALLRKNLADHNLPPLLGWLPRDDGLAMDERHLGLVLPEDQPGPNPEMLAEALQLDRDLLFRVLGAIPHDPVPDPPPSPDKRLAEKTIAVARDAAFCFLYPANLEWLEAMGARIAFFSPLAGEPLPPGSDALWMPGGYPELHLEALSNAASWESVRAFVAAEKPVLAECGGMMALGETLTDKAGTNKPMAGALPIRTTMTPKLAGLGYREEASGARGHEFHHSIREESDLPPAFVPNRGDGGLRVKGVRASYIHWYFPSAPDVIAGWFGAVPT